MVRPRVSSRRSPHAAGEAGTLPRSGFVQEGFYDTEQSRARSNCGCRAGIPGGVACLTATCPSRERRAVRFPPNGRVFLDGLTRAPGEVILSLRGTPAERSSHRVPSPAASQGGSVASGGNRRDTDGRWHSTGRRSDMSRATWAFAAVCATIVVPVRAAAQDSEAWHYGTDSTRHARVDDRGGLGEGESFLISPPP